MSRFFHSKLIAVSYYNCSKPISIGVVLNDDGLISFTELAMSD
jgi:hypothetical protein